MSKCDHITWLELLRGQAEPILAYGSRMSQVVGELSDPSMQSPQITFFMGRGLKNQALRRLCGASRASHGQQRSINLRVDNRTLSSAQPRIFADCDPNCQALPLAFNSPRICHNEENIPVQWPETDHSPHDIIIARLLLLFTDVICLFADDLGGLEGVRRLLLTWVCLGSASTLPRSVRPRVVVVLSDRSRSVTHDLLDEQDFLLDLFHPQGHPFFTTFADINISSLPSEKLSPDARFLQLGYDIASQLQQARRHREEHRALFSAIHLNALFDEALSHVATAPLAPFDLIRASRRQNPLDGAFTSHLVNFITVGGRTRAPYEQIASYIASAILMDAYPPRMHLFSPQSVFHSLYYDSLYTAHRQIYSTEDLAMLQCERIEQHLSALFARMITSGESSSQIHRHNLEGQRPFWTRGRSNETCFTCLRRSPEHILACGHSICDCCVQVFGECSPHVEHEYSIRQCLPCGGQQPLMVRLKPPTAAARVLSIDGGGPRGIVPLENLGLLQNLLGSDLPIFDLFDLSVGTSSGGLIVLTLILLRTEVWRCKEIFKSWSKQIFSPQQRKRFLHSWLSDSMYNSKALDNILRDHFTPTQRMFDTPPSLVSAGKVAVTTSSIQDGTPFLFANYNGSAPHRCDPAYGRLRPSVENEPFLWQVARATAAAPPLFSTVDIPGVGTFQDGGIRRHNNPVTVAILEARHLWPNIVNPDVVVSLGTGSETLGHSPKATSFRNILVDGWIPRAYRSFMASFDGQHSWRELQSLLDDKTKDTYHRFDITFPGAPPAMDSVGSMESLSHWVRAQSSNNKDRTGVARALLVSSFFFELTSTPEFRSGLFYCNGVVRCRGPVQSAIRSLLALEPKGRWGFYKDQINLGFDLSLDDICSACHRYARPVQFYARNLEEQLTLSLRQNVTVHHLSAFPTTLQWLIEQQGLSCLFGAANHSIPLRAECTACGTLSARGKKRKYVDI